MVQLTLTSLRPPGRAQQPGRSRTSDEYSHPTRSSDDLGFSCVSVPRGTSARRISPSFLLLDLVFCLRLMNEEPSVATRSLWRSAALGLAGSCLFLLSPAVVSAKSERSTAASSGVDATRDLGAAESQRDLKLEARLGKEVTKLDANRNRLRRTLKKKNLSKDGLDQALKELDQQIAEAKRLSDRIETSFSGSDQAQNQKQQLLMSILRALREMKRSAASSGL